METESRTAARVWHGGGAGSSPGACADPVSRRHFVPAAAATALSHFLCPGERGSGLFPGRFISERHRLTVRSRTTPGQGWRSRPQGLWEAAGVRWPSGGGAAPGAPEARAVMGAAAVRRRSGDAGGGGGRGRGRGAARVAVSGDPWRPCAPGGDVD